MALLILGPADVMQQRGHLQDGALLRSWIPEALPSRRQSVIELEAEPGHVPGVLEVGIEQRGPQLQTKQGGGFGLLSGRGAGCARPARANLCPAIFSAIGFDSLGALLAEFCSASGSGHRRRGRRWLRTAAGHSTSRSWTSPSRSCMCFEIVAPGSVLLGQKVFHDVAKALDSDAKPVKCRLGAAAQRLAMQLVGFRPALERKMLEDQAARPQPCHPARQRAAPALPLLAVEFCKRLHGFLLAAGPRGQRRIAAAAPVTGSSGLSRRCTHSCITCTSRSSPRRRKRRLPAFFMSFQAGSGSMAATPSAMEQQRRRATRRSCTGSGAKADAGAVAFFEDALHPEGEAGFLFGGLYRHGQRDSQAGYAMARHSGCGQRFRPVGAVSFLARTRSLRLGQ